MGEPLSDKMERVFKQAVDTCRQREEVHNYGDSWRLPTGIRGTFVHAETKVERLRHQLWDHITMDTVPVEQALDSALDLVNYGAFMVILLQEEAGRRIRMEQK